MQMKQLDALTYVAAQISLCEIESLKQHGIATIIVARPEGETMDQPALSDIREAATALGIEVHQIPVVPGQITDEDVQAFGAIMSDATAPVLAYCRSGMRAASLWALNEAQKGRAIDDLLRATKAANFDIAALVPRLVANAPKA